MEGAEDWVSKLVLSPGLLTTLTHANGDGLLAGGNFGAFLGATVEHPFLELMHNFVHLVHRTFLHCQSAGMR